MAILITGATGFIGRSLVKAFSAFEEVTVVGRDWVRLEQVFSSNYKKITWAELSTLSPGDFDLIIHLAGKSIDSFRWSSTQLKEIYESRLNSLDELIGWILRSDYRPRLLVANGVGVYGMQSFEDLRSFGEEDPVEKCGKVGTLASLGQAIEKGVHLVSQTIEVSSLRFGLVLKKEEGILKHLVPFFSYGMGGVLGSGKQVLSWIHIEDLIRSILFLIQYPVEKAWNLTSPFPVSQKEFANCLARALNRPCFFTAPKWLIELAFGKQAELLLTGQRVVPSKLIAQGFEFSYPRLEEALALGVSC